MHKLIITLILLTIFTSCEKKYDMYEMSEMAALMEKMYQDHEILKTKIQKGDSIGTIQMDYSKIHSAQFTNSEDDTPEFKAMAEAFLQSQQALYDADSAHLKSAYTQSVNSCIACHTTVGCMGPIPRIKKLKLN